MQRLEGAVDTDAEQVRLAAGQRVLQGGEGGIPVPQQGRGARHVEGGLAPGGKLEGLDLVSLGGRDGSPSHVNLLTLHSSKGCEYDVVIMVGMDQGMMPWAKEKEAELKESRRLFYVGLTRARDAVHLLYSGWFQDRYGPRFLGRSTFVEELEERLVAAEQAR